MATLVLTAVGSQFGRIGATIGTIIGQQIDSRIFGGGSREGPRLQELKLTTSSYGAPIPRHFGRMRVSGQIIWSTDLTEHREKQSNGKGKPSTINYSYTASFAVALSSRPIESVGRIWADGKLLRGSAGDLKTGGTFRLHSGEGDQDPDPLIAAAQAAGQCPAHRGLAYAVFENLQLADYGNRIPTLSFEVFADSGAISIDRLLDGVIEDFDAAVPLTGLAGISDEGSLSELLSMLDPLYPVDCDACDERLAIRPDRHQTLPAALPEAATSNNRDDFGGNAGFSRTRSAQDEKPLAVLRYYDLDRDYQPGAQRAPGRPVSGQPRSIDLPASLDATSAQTLVAAAAQRSQWSRQTVSWRVTQLDPAVRPGADVTLPGHPGRWRVSDWEWRSHGVDLTLVRLSAVGIASGFTADPGRGNPAPDLPLASTSLIAAELPWDGNASTPVPLIMAYPSSPGAGWSGAALYVDQGDGALLPLGPAGRTRSVIGTVQTALRQASPLIFDRASRLTVSLVGADLPLANASMRQLAMGANRALVGSEIIQFASAEPLGGGQWELSGLWRGRGGTEAAVAGHTVGEPFVLVDGGGTALDASAVGTTPDARIAAIGLGDTAPAYSEIALAGIGRRPLAPVHGRIAVGSDGSWRISWTRRARGAWLWPDGSDVPLVEQAQAYDITFGTASTTVSGWTTDQPELLITASAAAALLAAAAGGWFSIVQRGDRGLSEALIVPPPAP